MMQNRFLLLVLLAFLPFTLSWHYDTTLVGQNLNQNETATDSLDYWGEWTDHEYHPSPDNWRFPYYTLFLDRFVNGDPTNDDANGTMWEHDLRGTQLRHGGDIKGLQGTLDYLQGMGIKGIYIAGSPMINLPWGSDAYSPLDLTLLDSHFGDIQAWRDCITEIHKRGMYVLMDNTMGTMGDLIGFDGYLNVSAPFEYGEHDALWKTSRRYADFSFGNHELDSCDYPRWYNDSGYEVTDDGTQKLIGCRDSDFDQYGDIQAFGTYSEWRRQLSKFGSVQDRLREWKPTVLDKISHLSCLQIRMLDLDGFRMDKGIQITVDAHANFSSLVRQCAVNLGKTNFMVASELVGGNAFNAIYVGRGKLASQVESELDKVVTTTGNETSDADFIREAGKSAADAACFDYSIFRTLLRFLGMDGSLSAAYDIPVDFVEGWNYYISSHDFINANTGEFDPRHMYGVQNQDQFRWPGLENGTDRQNLGTFIVTMLMPGSPIIEWGEEQAFYVLDSTAANYQYGRQAFSSTTAWQDHGCYKMGSSIYHDWPTNSSVSYGCKDDWNSLDHRDPSHPVRNLMKTMFEFRSRFPVLNDGWYVEQLSKQTHDIYLPGSKGTPTEKGIWSVLRSGWPDVQDFTEGQGNQEVWLVYMNEGEDKRYYFDCSMNSTSLAAPFAEGTTVRNMFYPFEEYTLLTGQGTGCLETIKMPAYGFKAFVPAKKWLRPSPVITKFVPGHDNRIESSVAADEYDEVDIELHFSDEMDCTALQNAMSFTSKTLDGSVPELKNGSVECNVVSAGATTYVGQIATGWVFSATLSNVAHGVHEITITNATTQDGNATTSAVDHFLIRVGDKENPMVFPRTGNYSASLLSKDDSGTLSISHNAAGADRFRYSTNFETSWSQWKVYNGGNTTIESQSWAGTKAQAWVGDHVEVQYWSALTGSSDHIQHGDVFPSDYALNYPRRFPHFFIQGTFNEYGYDSGISSKMDQEENGTWTFDLVAEWPASFLVNVWGMNPNGKPDKTRSFGDVDEDNILDLLAPVTLQENTAHVNTTPKLPYHAYRIILNDATLRYSLKPIGSWWVQLIFYILAWFIPVATAVLLVYLYQRAFYDVKRNIYGKGDSKSPNFLKRMLNVGYNPIGDDKIPAGAAMMIGNASSTNVDGVAPVQSCQTILLATMEYFIEDWNIKVKIGGLGIMAQLMGDQLKDKQLIWVIPCLGEIDYPVDIRAEPMHVKILDKEYDIEVQYHVVNNITFVLLDAPVFRKQTKARPYPERMDDFDSAILYSAWNACIADVIRRFPQIDLYHINDYHGAIAPLYILPQVIPCVLSLHNAEFQGLWGIRTPKDMTEISGIFNLDPSIIKTYVQFGEVFNLLHGAASYLRIHQKGFGAVGVSSKYGKRSFARYPIFWGLKKIGSLPNPDPTDTGDVIKTTAPEGERAALKKQAQEWAHLNTDPSAELFCFVGRWSSQKGIDLIADLFPSILAKHPKAQLITIGPVIDLYGKFAALKLGKLSKRYPGRVCSIPEFTQIPPFVFSGVDWALIPSRDEPFGLVAVEFGRRGVLSIGARVGGLGSMPGWWFTIESMTTRHLIDQFRKAVEAALASPQSVRETMRSQALSQRFPVSQWKVELAALQEKAVRVSRKQAKTKHLRSASNIRIDVRDTSRQRPVSSGSELRSPMPGGERPRTEIYSATPESPMSADGNRPDTSKGFPFSESSNGPDFIPDEWPQRRGRRLSRDGGLGLDPPSWSHVHSRASSVGTMEMINGGHRNAYPHPRDPRQWSDDDDEVRSTIMQDYMLEPEESESTARARSLDPRRDSQYTVGTAHSELDYPPSPAWRQEGSLLSPALPGLRGLGASQANSSALSLDAVTLGKETFELQNIDPVFTDPKGQYYDKYEKILDEHDMDEKTTNVQPIEDFLVDSEKEWHSRRYNLKMGEKDPFYKHSGLGSKRSSIFASTPFGRSPDRQTPAGSIYDGHEGVSEIDDEDKGDQFLISGNYSPPKGFKRWLLIKLGDWPVYSCLLAVGQIIAANSYQISLLSGQVGQAAIKLYVLSGIYAVTSILWWMGFRLQKSLYCLTLPFFIYGLAFLILSVSPLIADTDTRKWLQNVASGLYSAASSSGSFYFALNFGNEGSVPVTTWAFRAAIIQGLQQAYVVLLWFWGARLTMTSEVVEASSSTYLAIALPIAIVLWAIGIALFFGLPDYYRQTPGQIPSFYKSLLRRNIFLWFLVVVVVQNFFLSAPYGRNWKYLWSSSHAPSWAIGLLIIFFFGGVWVAMLYCFSRLSRSHSWALPIFAVGLGAPRWAQMLWATSGMGQYFPAGNAVVGALLGRSLWLWLGVLDAIQNVGYGMILLQTMTRFHVVFTLVAAQTLGAATTILARAVAPDKDGPGPVFPNLALSLNGLANAWFWVGLGSQLILCVGFLKFFRKEQLQKP